MNGSNFHYPGSAQYQSQISASTSYINSSGTSETIELNFSCQDLLDADTFSKSDPYIEVYLNMENRKGIFLGKTETVQNQLNPCFLKPVYLQYQYEAYQQLEIRVYDQDEGNKRDFLGMTTVTVPTVLMSPQEKGLTLNLTLENGTQKGKVIIKHEKVSLNAKNYYLKVRCTEVKDIEWFSKSDPFIRIYRPSSQFLQSSYNQAAQIPPSGWIQCHETEHYDDNLNPSFLGFYLQSNLLNSNDEQVNNKWEIWDWESDGCHRLISTGFSSISAINQPGFSFNTVDKKGKFAGKIIIETVQKRKIFQISDYLRIGLRFHLSVGIDFTGSNGIPTNPKSLHYIPPGGFALGMQMNQYMKAITQVGQIVIEYDDDKMVPAFGYGANLPRTNQVNHCFPLNLNFENPFVQGVEGLLAAYAMAVTTVSLNGPTYFAPLLRECLQSVKQGYVHSKMNYTILLIITDGQINDFNDTVSILVEASDFPMSVIIIGVGDADFTGMEGLDSDGSLLVDYKTGRKAKRDIVQFAPFRNYSNNPVHLAEEVLRELPAQVDQFYQLINISPE